MKKFAALALVALFSVAFTGSVQAVSASQSPSEVVKANKKKKKKGAEACAPSKAKSCGTAAPAGKSCCSKPAAAGGAGK
ncbi:MAG: hypothetical protein NWR91_04420 [Schleiferiaceae bacterium]|nr:hypothetical protein [Schleiferiaceae bacterium]